MGENLKISIVFNSNSFGLTEKQRPFFEWVMAKLGFVDDVHTKTYITRLQHNAFRYRFTRRIPVSLFKPIFEKKDGANYAKQIQELKRYGFNTFMDEKDSNIDGNICHALYKLYQEFSTFYIPKYYGVLDFLSDELRMKERGLILRIQNPNLNSISATDIANYSYCSVAYVISKTFEQEKILAAEVGTLLHEQAILKSLLLKLGKRLQGIVVDGNYQRTMNDALPRALVNDLNGYFFKDIAESELIHIGHDQSKSYFKNREMNFIGMPDYVYRQKNGKYFFVEEKFMLMRDSSGAPPFYENHVNQLDAYVSLINEIDVVYGYLVYWLYTFEGGRPVVKNCIVKRDEKTDYLSKNILGIKNEIEGMKRGVVQQFVRNQDRVNKCSGCVYSRICGHKTGRYDSFNFPYDTTFLQTFSAQYNNSMEAEFNALYNKSMEAEFNEMLNMEAEFNEMLSFNDDFSPRSPLSS